MLLCLKFHFDAWLTFIFYPQEQGMRDFWKSDEIFYKIPNIIVCNDYLSYCKIVDSNIPQIRRKIRKSLFLI